LVAEKLTSGFLNKEHNKSEFVVVGTLLEKIFFKYIEINIWRNF